MAAQWTLGTCYLSRSLDRYLGRGSDQTEHANLKLQAVERDVKVLARLLQPNVWPQVGEMIGDVILSIIMFIKVSLSIVKVLATHEANTARPYSGGYACESFKCADPATPPVMGFTVASLGAAANRARSLGVGARCN